MHIVNQDFFLTYLNKVAVPNAVPRTKAFVKPRQAFIKPRPCFAWRGFFAFVCVCVSVCLSVCVSVNKICQKILNLSTPFFVEAFPGPRGETIRF